MQHCSLFPGGDFAECPPDRHGCCKPCCGYILEEIHSHRQECCCFHGILNVCGLPQHEHTLSCYSDPTADVDGHDACRKICILAALAFGEHVYPDQVPTEGIRGVTLEDVAYADSIGFKIKLLGRAIRQPENKVCAFVAPHLVPAGNPIAGVEDVFNAIAVNGNAVGDTMFYGRGAGKLPTASAVVADVADLARDLKRDHRNAWGPGAADLVVSSDILASRWYIRTFAGVDAARQACGEIQLLARAGAPAGEVAFLTTAMTQPELKEKLGGMEISSLFRVLE